MEDGYSFIRYLAAKKSVDDRALNAHVREVLLRALQGKEQLFILEVGAGIGTMIERLHEQRLLPPRTTYTAIDSQSQNIDEARRRLLPLQESLSLELEAIDVFQFVERESGQRQWDLLIAHAFLDLVDLQAALPQLFSLLKPGGHFYFTINFDGLTLLQPTIDPVFDEKVMTLYHRTMDTRLVNGRPSGDSQTGRKLFSALPAAGAEIMAAGSSDWILYAGQRGYHADEAYFLHFIINTIDLALRDLPDLDQDRFADWIARRHAQIEDGTLVYIAHQLDFSGALPAPGTV